MYTYPYGNVLGAIAGVWLLVAAAIALWRSSALGSQQQLRSMQAVAALGFTGTLLTITSIDMFVVEYLFHRSVLAYSMELPKPTWLILAMTVVALWMLLVMATVSIVRRQGLVLVTMLTCAFATLANLATIMEFRTDGPGSDAWALVNAIGWQLTFVAAITLAVLFSVTQIRAFGQRRYVAGVKAGMQALSHSQAYGPEGVEV